MLKRTRTLMGSLAVAAVMSFVPTLGGAFAETYWQCVPFARLVSGIQLFGDAYTWWQQAIGKYEEGFQPKTGAVLCFKPTQRMRLGHVAVVSEVLTDRIVQITHANWSPIDGGRGKVEKDVTLVDVSPEGNWSQVKVWYDPSRDLGGSTYETYGFIYPDARAKLLAATGLSNAENTAIAMAQSAASQMASAVRPGSGPLQMLNQAADSTDRIAALIAKAARGDNGGN
ncbi:MAG TPA: CHAP domain-containing protein [Phenylobacterium sp.]|nr:CHAP domain-containing protein [Phenylobacterium sp.]